MSTVLISMSNDEGFFLLRCLDETAEPEQGRTHCVSVLAREVTLENV